MPAADADPSADLFFPLPLLLSVQCRVPIQPAELVMKIATVYTTTAGQSSDDSHSKLLVV